jgi:FecR protein
MATVLIAALGSGLFFLSRSSPMVTPSPVVLVVDRGTAILKPRGKPDWNVASSGALLHAGDTLHTLSQTSASIEFPDGSKARLGPDAELRVKAAWMNRRGVVSTATLSHYTGRVLYSIATAPGTDFVVVTNAVSFEAGASAFEVNLQPDGLLTIKVFEGVVNTRPGATRPFTGPLRIQAGEQQMYDDIIGPIGSIEALQADPLDPFVQTQRAEAAAAAIVSTPGTEKTFSSLEPLQTGQTETAGEYSTGGGEVTALLTNSGSEMGLTIIGPGGQAYRAQGVAPLIVTIPNAPPGSYRAEVTGTRVRAGGDTYALAFVVASACNPAEGNGYTRTVQGWKEVADSVKIARVSDVKVIPVIGSAEVLLYSTVAPRGGRGAVTALIYATPPTIQLLPLSLNLQGVQLPPRATGPVSVPALNARFKVDRVYACAAGLAIEGASV